MSTIYLLRPLTPDMRELTIRATERITLGRNDATVYNLVMSPETANLVYLSRALVHAYIDKDCLKIQLVDAAKPSSVMIDATLVRGHNAHDCPDGSTLTLLHMPQWNQNLYQYRIERQDAPSPPPQTLPQTPPPTTPTQPDDIAEELECPICSNIHDEPRVLRPCNHVFCNKCIRDWLSIRPTCPMCSAPAAIQDSLTIPLLTAVAAKLRKRAASDNDAPTDDAPPTKRSKRAFIDLTM